MIWSWTEVGVGLALGLVAVVALLAGLPLWAGFAVAYTGVGLRIWFKVVRPVLRPPGERPRRTTPSA